MNTCITDRVNGEMLGFAGSVPTYTQLTALKMARVWQRDYASHMEAIKDITEYIVEFYNGVRLHSTLSKVPPMIYEMELAA